VSEPSKKKVDTKRSEFDFFIRFKLSQRLEHLVLLISFVALAVTGLAQRFYTAEWAEWVILNLGGIDYTRLVHRGFGLIFTLSAIYHLGYLAYTLFFRHSKPSMVPSLKDVRDVVALVDYNFGFGNEPPQFDRFDYRQKFEYWGIVFGGTIMIITGFIMAYPLLFTNVLPGQLVAAAGEVHGNEAMLAVLVVVIWHLYDVIFKPGIFPADTSIFTGKISRKRMLEEHGLEYAALTGADAGETTDEASSEESSADSPAG
jgi:formate dehydrogenase gamma subunit